MVLSKRRNTNALLSMWLSAHHDILSVRETVDLLVSYYTSYLMFEYPRMLVCLLWCGLDVSASLDRSFLNSSFRLDRLVISLSTAYSLSVAVVSSLVFFCQTKVIPPSLNYHNPYSYSRVLHKICRGYLH